MAVNKITIDGTTRLDLSGITVTSGADIVQGKTGITRAGEIVAGSASGGSYTNPLYGKILAVNGDSIAAGVGNNGTGFPELIATANSMTLDNEAVGGATIATGTASSHYICSTISDLRSDADYILLEGGVNDPDFGVSLGSISSGKTGPFDTTTFAGGFETMLQNALSRFPDKKIGYVFVHKCGNFSETWHSLAVSILTKWDIPYCDLYHKFPFVADNADIRTTYTSSGDGYHPNADGYNAFYVDNITLFLMRL